MHLRVGPPSTSEQLRGVDGVNVESGQLEAAGAVPLACRHSSRDSSDSAYIVSTTL
jgi:hypothetical protein